MSKLVLSGTPHIKIRTTTKRIMIDVCIALMPACIVGIIYFGYKAALILAVSVIAAVASEMCYALMMKKPFKSWMKEFDFTSVVTGLLIGMNMNAAIPLYIPVIACVFAIIVVKMIFGGTGRNLFNPAIAGRVFVFLSFFTLMSGGWIDPSSGSVLSGSTPLTELLTNGSTSVSNLDLFLGNIAGCLGETSAAALIAGGVYLAICDIIDIKWPLIYIGVTGLAAVMLGGFNFSIFLPSILSGGLMLGAIFMATDYTTTPNTVKGNFVYFIMLGILTALLRHFMKIEVVSFAILLMNICVPIIDKYLVNKPFGSENTPKVAKEAK